MNQNKQKTSTRFSGGEMKTVILATGHFQVAITDNPIPLNEDKSVNYNEYVRRITKSYPVKVNRDLTEVF